MIEHQKVSTQEAPAEVVHFGNGRSMSRDLYRRYRRMIRLFWVAALSPLIYLMFYAVTPTTVLMALAATINDLFWTHFKSVSLENCGAKCSLVAFSVIAVALSWGASIVLALVAIPLTVQLRSAQAEALRRGQAPMGRMPDGTAKPLPNAGTAVPVLVVAMVAVGVMLFAVVYGLYTLGGSGRTTHPTTGVEYSIGAISVIITLLTSAAQFGAILLMFFAMFFALSLKSALEKLLRRLGG